METNKVYCGDCLELMKDIPDGSIDMILADLPYGTSNCKWDEVIPLGPLWEQYNRIIKDNGAIVLFGMQPFTSKLIVSNLKHYKYDWMWQKEKGLGFLNAKKMPLRDTENISVFYKKQPTYNPQMTPGKPYRAFNNPDKQKGINHEYNRVETINNGERYPVTTLKFNRPRRTLHATQKPVELCEYLIKTYTNEGDIVLDNVIGSGTTAIAAIRTGRRFIGIELDQENCNIAYNRIKEETK